MNADESIRIKSKFIYQILTIVLKQKFVFFDPKVVAATTIHRRVLQVAVTRLLQ